MTDNKIVDLTDASQCCFECTDTDLFVVLDGVRIAKRGQPDTPQAKTWISLEPGFVVRDSRDLKAITVEKNGVEIQ